MPDQKFITIDIGSAWTKAFLVKLDPENRINIENSLRLPTSWGDFSISVDNLLSKFSQKDSPKTFVSQFAEVETLAAKEQGSFVKEEEAASHLAKYFKIGHQNVSIIDGGASNFKGVFPAEEIGKLRLLSSSRSLKILSRISFAALLVKVMAKIEEGCAPFLIK